MQPVSLTKFADFVNKAGTPKMTVVRDVLRQQSEDYEPAKDFWKPLREAIVDLHQEGRDKSSLDAVLDTVSHKKLERYGECISGYKKFLGRKTLIWTDPPKEIWQSGNLQVRVNPEIGLTQDGVLTLYKLYFKDDPLAKRAVDVMLTLMKDALPSEAGVGIIDVSRGKSFTAADEKFMPLLHGEAANFATTAHHLS